MFVLKKRFEDFRVEEEFSGKTSDSGSFLLVKLTKTNWNTISAIKQLAKRLHMPMRSFGYSGLKDKHGVTTQFVSIASKTWEAVQYVKIKDIELDFAGYIGEPIGLGSCDKNSFTIKVRNLDEELRPIEFISNYYDEQRFGARRPNTHFIGKALVQKKYEEAARILLKESYACEQEEHRQMRDDLPWPDITPEHFPTYLDAERSLSEALVKHDYNYEKAFALMPRRLLTLYVQAYQSFLFNKVLREKVVERSNEIEILSDIFPVGSCPEDELPLVGYDYDGDDEVILEVLKQEGISPKDFENSFISHLSSKTVMRKTQIPVSIILGSPEADEEFAGKNCQQVQFTLPKGTYATMVIKQMA